MLSAIHWLGHASFRLEIAGKVIYIDPWKLGSVIPADIVLVTHDHHDHLSPSDIARIVKPGTEIVYAGKGSPELKGSLHHVSPGDTLQLGEVTVSAVHAYNVGKAFHPRDAGFVGYVVTVGGTRVYHAGDTDVIPEMADVRCDVALLPVGGKYTMTAEEAARALELIKPQAAVPMHFGDIIGGADSARMFSRLAPPEVQVTLLEPEH